MEQEGNVVASQTAVVSPKTSKLAITSFVMGLVSLVICVLWPILALPAIICGIIALVKISGSNGQLKGNGFAITGIVIPMVAMLLVLPVSLAILMPALNKTKKVAQRVICSTNLKSLGTAIIVYANDNGDRLPAANQWCDLLIMECDVAPKSLICPSSDAVEGESSYAMNINVDGKMLDKLPGDMVLLFETEVGKEQDVRTATVEDRRFFKYFEEQGSSIGLARDTEVHSKRWNQAGGPEIMKIRHTKDGCPGCNVVFVEGRPAFITGDDLKKLRWTVEEKRP